MTMNFPAAFAGVARLSAIEEVSRGRHDGELVSAYSEEVWRKLFSGPSDRQLAIQSLSDADLKSLIGWVCFGREYNAHLGDPVAYLQLCINAAWVRPRWEAEGYVSDKPIARYLKLAVQALTGILILTPQQREAFHPRVAEMA